MIADVFDEVIDKYGYPSFVLQRQSLNLPGSCTDVITQKGEETANVPPTIPWHARKLDAIEVKGRHRSATTLGKCDQSQTWSKSTNQSRSYEKLKLNAIKCHQNAINCYQWQILPNVISSTNITEKKVQYKQTETKHDTESRIQSRKRESRNLLRQTIHRMSHAESVIQSRQEYQWNTTLKLYKDNYSA